MNYFKYLENKEHETGTFPVAYYKVCKNHPQYNMIHHWHKEAELLYVRQGKLQLTINRTEYEVCAGEFCYISSGYVHGATPNDCVYECIDFNINSSQLQIPIVRDFLNSVDKKHCVIQPHFTEQQPEILNILCSLFDVIDTRDDGWEIIFISHLLAFYGCIRQNNYICEKTKTLSNQNMVELKAVIEYIEQNYQNHVSLDELSKVMGMCSKYFCKIFRDVFNKTPIDYLNSFRIEKACELLSLGQNSITEVAFLCGFNDSCYFARCFKKYKNTTPKKYAIEKR